MKLEWEQNPPTKPMTWDEAIEYAKSLGDGWTLSAKEELLDAYFTEVKGFQSDHYWSSSEFAQVTNHAWIVSFSYGKMYYNTKMEEYYVRCVRNDHLCNKGE